MKPNGIPYSLLTVALRASLLVALLLSGWLIYKTLPQQSASVPVAKHSETTLQIVLSPPAANAADSLDIAVELYPFDIVAARHEYFTERRAGKRFDDFLKERMQGRAPIATKLDKQGQAIIVVGKGSWWLHAQLSGEENLEWRLPIDASGQKQLIELTTQNVYTRSRSF